MILKQLVCCLLNSGIFIQHTNMEGKSQVTEIITYIPSSHKGDTLVTMKSISSKLTYNLETMKSDNKQFEIGCVYNVINGHSCVCGAMPCSKWMLGKYKEAKYETSTPFNHKRFNILRCMKSHNWIWPSISLLVFRAGVLQAYVYIWLKKYFCNISCQIS